MRKSTAGVTPKSEGDLGSFEGKYPKDLFNKTFVIDNQSIGHMAKDTEILSSSLANRTMSGMIYPSQKSFRWEEE